MSRPSNTGLRRHHVPPWLRQFPPDHPAVLDFRMSDVEARVDSLEEDQAGQTKTPSKLAGLPWVQIASVAITVGIGLLLNLKPDEIAALVKAARP